MPDILTNITMQKEIKSDVLILCGMAESNSRTPPNHVYVAFL